MKTKSQLLIDRHQAEQKYLRMGPDLKMTNWKKLLRKTTQDNILA